MAALICHTPTSSVTTRTAVTPHRIIISHHHRIIISHHHRIIISHHHRMILSHHYRIMISHHHRIIISQHHTPHRIIISHKTG